MLSMVLLNKTYYIYVAGCDNKRANVLFLIACYNILEIST